MGGLHEIACCVLATTFGTRWYFKWQLASKAYLFVHPMDILNNVLQAMSLRMALPNMEVFLVPFETNYEKQILAKAESNCAFFRDN